MGKKKQNKGKTKEEFKEVFELEKDGKSKTLVVEGKEESSPIPKDQIKKEKKMFKGLILTMVIILLFFGAFYWVVTSSQFRDYKGIEFQLIKEGSLLFYKTAIPVVYNNKPANYNFYLRIDPNLQKFVEFNSSDIELKKIVVINKKEDFVCEGDGIIALANLANLYKAIGANVITDPNATCDNQSRYNYINIVKGDKTKINVYGEDNECFEIQVKDCEILKATEKLMLETFVEYTKKEE